MSVSLRDVMLAVRYGDVSFVGESAGYIILGAADQALRSRQLATVDAVGLSIEGQVILDGSACSPEEAELGLRGLLSQLLELVRTPCRNLDRVAARRDRIGLSELVVELEAALVPVNRKAARRTLARLVRETKRSCAQERTFAEVVPVEHVEPEIPPPVPSPEPPAPAVWDHVAERVQQVVETKGVEGIRGPSFTSASLARIAERAGSQTPIESSEVADSEPAAAPSTARVISAVTEVGRPRPRAQPQYVEPEVLFDEDVDDDIDEEPTQVFARVVPRSEAESIGSVALARPQPPAPSRRRAPVAVRRRAIDPGASLIRASRSAPARRPSEISELLDKMTVEPQSADEVYLGLKSLSRVEISPPAPPVNAAWIESDGQ